MKYCTKCGNPIGEEKFCTKCGAPAPESAPVTPMPNAAPTATAAPGAFAPGGGTPQKSSKATLIVLGAAVLVVIAVIIFVCVSIFGGGYKKVIKEYVKGYEKGDAEIIVDLIPSEIIDEKIDSNNRYDDKDDIIDEIQDSIDDDIEYLEKQVGDKMKISYKIKYIESYDKDELEEIQDYLDNLDYDMEIKDAKSVKLRVTASGKDDDISSELYLTLIKIGGKWYCDGGGLI